jgi:hypothetical protein
MDNHVNANGQAGIWSLSPMVQVQLTAFIMQKTKRKGDDDKKGETSFVLSMLFALSNAHQIDSTA